MLNKANLAILISSSINLVLAVLDTILTFAKPLPKSSCNLTKALARSKRFINFNCNVCSIIFALFSILWVFTYPAADADAQVATTKAYDSNKNDTFSVVNVNYYGIFFRATKEYFLYLANHWFVCEVAKLTLTAVNVFSKIDFGKKYAIMAYAIYTLPTALYIKLTTDTLSCCKFIDVSAVRTMVWLVLVFVVLAMFTTVTCLPRKQLATTGPRKSKKSIWLFIEMVIMSGLLTTLHIVQLKTTLLTTQEYESFVGLGTVAMSFLWTVFSTWNDGICLAIRSRIQRAFNMEENIELRRHPNVAKGKRVVAATSVKETAV